MTANTLFMIQRALCWLVWCCWALYFFVARWQQGKTYRWRFSDYGMVRKYPEITTRQKSLQPAEASSWFGSSTDTFSRCLGRSSSTTVSNMGLTVLPSLFCCYDAPLPFTVDCINRKLLRQGFPWVRALKSKAPGRRRRRVPLLRLLGPTSIERKCAGRQVLLLSYYITSIASVIKQAQQEQS